MEKLYFFYFLIAPENWLLYFADVMHALIITFSFFRNENLSHPRFSFHRELALRCSDIE